MRVNRLTARSPASTSTPELAYVSPGVDAGGATPFAGAFFRTGPFAFDEVAIGGVYEGAVRPGGKAGRGPKKSPRITAELRFRLKRLGHRADQWGVALA